MAVAMKEGMTILLWLTSSLMISTVNSAVIIYNAALNKPAYQSSVHSSIYRNHSADLAVDGSYPHPCSHSQKETYPWWAVDLGRPTSVYRVDLTNSRNPVYAKAGLSNNFVVGLTDVSPLDYTPTLWNYTLCGQYPGVVAAGATVSLYCQENLPPFRYVVVQFLIRANYMEFCELEVLVRVHNEILRNVALNKTSFQISTYEDPFGLHSASLANDGSRQTNFLVHENGCAASNQANDPWWAVDLDVPTVVYEVNLTNRGDTAAYRSDNFIVGLTNRRPAPGAYARWHYTLCGQYPGAVPAGATVTVRCTNAYEQRLRYRYVIVQFPLINDLMNVCEVEVFAIDEEKYATNEPMVTETPTNHQRSESNSFFVVIIAISAVAGVVIIVAVILLIIVIKQRTDNKRLHQKISTYDARVSVGQGEDYATIPAPDSSSYQQLEMTQSTPTYM